MTLILSGTDGLSDVDGSASTPAIRGTDTNTGIFFPAADTIAFAEGGAEVARFDSSGNFGLGVTPGTYTNPTIVLKNGGGLNSQQDYLNIGANWTYDAPNYRYINSGQRATWYQQGAGAHYWFTAPSGTAGNAITFTENARINSDGFFKASNSGSYNQGTTTYEFSSNQNALTAVAQNTNASFAATCFQVNVERNTTNGTFNAIVYRNTGAAVNRFQVLDSGNVQNTNNSYGAISDAKLKENVTDATPKLEKLNQVRVVNYNLIGEQQKQIGVIAQELEQVFPGMVEETVDRDEEGNDLGTTTKSVKYSVFVPMLIKAIQELKAELDTAKARIAALEGAQA